MRTANLFDIQRNSFVDGPGIRTTVFFKGCNLRCQWCHNPESQIMESQIMFYNMANNQRKIMFYKDKCTGCGRCRDITVDNSDFVCFHDAKKICGKTYTVDELFNIIIKDKIFYETSGGGVTFSGGECLLQQDFLCEILEKCKAAGIHTAVDTAGHIHWNVFEKVLPYTDLFLYDMKAFDCNIHRKYTGVSNECILENLKKLFEAGANIWIRIPVIPGVNDTVKEMQKIKNFLTPYNPSKIELLPYHRMGEHKYTALGMKKIKFDVPDKNVMAKVNDVAGQ